MAQRKFTRLSAKSRAGARGLEFDYPPPYKNKKINFNLIADRSFKSHKS
jgi:hypothetical protein